MTPTQAAHHLSVHRRTLDRQVEAGRLQRGPATSKFFLSDILELNDARDQVSREPLIQRLVLKDSHPGEDPTHCADLEGILPL